MVANNTEYFTTLEMSQRFDLIHHLIENSEIIPLVRGPAGIGKSILARRVQQSAPDNWLVCLFEATPTLSPDQLFAYLARCSGMSSLAENLIQGLVGRFEMMREQGRVPVILVDDAQLLPPTALIALLRLFERQHGDGPLVSIVLFADEQIDKLLSTPQLQIMTPLAVQVIDMQPLNREDATSFMHFLLQVENLPADLELESSRLTKLYRTSRGNPGLLREEILNALSPTSEKKPPEVNLSKYPLYGIVAAILLIGFVLFFQPEINRLFEKPQVSEENTAELDQLPESSVVASTESHEDQQVDLPSLDPALDVASPSEGLLIEDESFEHESIEDVTNNEILDFHSIMTIDDRLGVENPPVENQMSEEISASEMSGLPPDNPEYTPAKTELLPQPDSQVDDVSESSLSTSEISVATPIESEADAVLPKRVEPSEDPLTALNKEAWVRERPANHFTIQLLGVENLTSLYAFVQRHKLHDEVFFIRTQRNGKPWYPLFFGEFPDKQSAINAKKNLPLKVNQNGAWPRPYRELHQLLDQ